MDPASIIKELRMFQANASQMERWAAIMIEKLEVNSPKKRMKGLSDEQVSRGLAARRKFILRKINQ